MDGPHQEQKTTQIESTANMRRKEKKENTSKKWQKKTSKKQNKNKENTWKKKEQKTMDKTTQNDTPVGTKVMDTKQPGGADPTATRKGKEPILQQPQHLQQKLNSVWDRKSNAQTQKLGRKGNSRKSNQKN